MQVVLSLSPGGTERLVIDLATRLSEQFRSVVCCLDGPGAWADEVRATGVPVIALHRAPGFHPAIGAQIAQIVRTHRVDVIHCHHYSPFVYSRFASWLAPGVGFVFTEHGRLSDSPPTTKRRMANAVLTRFGGSLFSVSGALKQHMVAEGFPARRVTVIHNGIDPGMRPAPDDRAAARIALGVSPQDFIVGTAARLDVVKDLPALVHAIALVRSREPNAKLVIVGDGEERKTIESAIRQHGLDGAVVMAGYRADVRRLLPAMDVYANSSHSEGVSLTILEAMAAARPVVATRVGGTPEIVEHDATGLLVDARSPAAMAEAILQLAASPDRRAAFGAAGRERVEARFTIDRMVTDYAREYMRACAPRGAR